MQRGLGACLLFAFAAIPMQPAGAAGLPEIKVSATNRVPACATPGRMIDYLKSRNPELDPRYDSVATEYMRIGEALGVRWDFAFYQMIIETGALSYRNGNRSGDVKPAQNNFAGLGATGGGETGESFKDIATGVRGHLEHLLLLFRPAGRQSGRRAHAQGAGVGRADALAREVHPAHHVQPTSPPNGRPAATPTAGCWRRSPRSSTDDFCSKPDPRPELVAEARGQQPKAERRWMQASRAADPAPSWRSARSKTARRRIRPGPRSAPRTPPRRDRRPGPATPSMPLPRAQTRRRRQRASRRPSPKDVREGEGAAPPPALLTSKPAAPRRQGTDARGLRRRIAAKQIVEPPAAGQKCRVWTASYGGQKAMIIRSLVDKVVNYTVLDVNEGAEKREADAFICRLRQGRQDHRRIRQPVAGARQGLRALPRRLSPLHAERRS